MENLQPQASNTWPERLEEESSLLLTQSESKSQPALGTQAWAFRASWAVNVALLIAKIVAYASTGSKAVLASLADSAVDLASQVIISISQHLMQQKSDEYPIGRTRLEALGVIGCACIMSMASMEVIQYSLLDLWRGIVLKEAINVDATLVMYVVLGAGTAMKVVLYFYCFQFKDSDLTQALAEDHINDVGSNLAAIITASIAGHVKKLWYIDPIGAIIISLIILYRWAVITWEQMKKLVGLTAPPEFIEEVKTLATGHSQLLCVDCLRAYHFGKRSEALQEQYLAASQLDHLKFDQALKHTTASQRNMDEAHAICWALFVESITQPARYIVELEIILPGDMTVQESHDLSLELQHKIEAMSQVERAFVHVDHQQRMVPEHKVERSLLVDALKRRNPRGESHQIALPEIRGSQMLVSAQ